MKKFIPFIAIIMLWMFLTLSAYAVENIISEQDFTNRYVDMSCFEPTFIFQFGDIVQIDCKNFKVKFLKDDIKLREAANQSFKLFWMYFGECLKQKGKEINMESEHKFMRIIERAIGQMDENNTLSECIAEICLKENIDPVEVGEWIKNFKGLMQVIEHNAKKFKTLKHQNIFETISISEYF